MRRSGRVWKYAAAALVVLVVGVFLSEVSAQGTSKLAELLLGIFGNTEEIKAEMLTNVTGYHIRPKIFDIGHNKIDCDPDRDILLHAVVAPFIPGNEGTVEVGQTLPNTGFNYTMNVTEPAGLTYGVPAGDRFHMEVTGAMAVISIQFPDGADLGCVLE